MQEIKIQHFLKFQFMKQPKITDMVKDTKSL